MSPSFPEAVKVYTTSTYSEIRVILSLIVPASISSVLKAPSKSHICNPSYDSIKGWTGNNNHCLVTRKGQVDHQEKQLTTPVPPSTIMDSQHKSDNGKNKPNNVPPMEAEITFSMKVTKSSYLALHCSNHFLS